jgi:predicted metalloprotease with PDZ domain
VVTYTFDDVVATLNEVAAYDWKNLFTVRLNSTGPNAPLSGLAASGWKLVFTDVMNEHLRATQEANKLTDARFSLGIILRRDEGDKDDGAIIDVIPGTPAAQAGIAPGMRLAAVNGQRWSPEVLREALHVAKGAAEPIELLVENAGFYKTYRCNAHDGERYPHLVREPSRPDLLEQIIRPRAGRTARSANP